MYATEIAEEAQEREIDGVRHSCPCFYCGSHLPKKDGDVDLDDPDTLEFKCVKNHELTEDYRQTISDTGCPDFDPEGGILDRAHITDDIDQAKMKYSARNVAQAFKLIGQAMIDAADKELADK